MLLRLSDHSYVNTESIVSMYVESRFYVNGSVSTLVIKLTDGKVYRVESGRGVDIYELEKRIVEAMS